MKNEVGGACSIYVRQETCMQVGRPNGKSPLGRPKCRLRIILKCTLKNWDGEAWTGLICLRIWTSGGLL
jgi:hypothetical protein